KKASALAHKMKHSPKADRTTTGITADAVILLANILRRLEDGCGLPGRRGRPSILLRRLPGHRQVWVWVRAVGGGVFAARRGGAVAAGTQDWLQVGVAV